MVPADDALVKAVAERTGKFETEWIKMVNDKGMDGKAILAEYRAEVKKLTLPSEMGERFQMMGFARDVEFGVAFMAGDLSFRL